MDTAFTIYIDDKPHRLSVSVKITASQKKYKVEQDLVNKIHILPESFIIDTYGKMESQNGHETVEQQQLIRLIWQHISNIMSI